MLLLWAIHKQNKQTTFLNRRIPKQAWRLLHAFVGNEWVFQIWSEEGWNLLALPTNKAKHIVFRFIIEYNSSLMDFGPYIIGLFLYEDFWKMIFWLVLKLEISYRVIITWRIWGFFFFLGVEERFKIIFLHGEINIGVFIILLCP